MPIESLPTEAHVRCSIRAWIRSFAATLRTDWRYVTLFKHFHRIVRPPHVCKLMSFLRINVTKFYRNDTGIPRACLQHDL
jgi:hypothetical protein